MDLPSPPRPPHPSHPSSSVEGLLAKAPQQRPRTALIAVLAGTALVLLVLWGITLRSIQREYHDADRGAARSVQSVADVYEAQVLRAIREIDLVLGWLRHDQASGRGSLAVFEAAGLQMNPLLTVMRFDAQGRLVESSRPGAPVPPREVLAGAAGGGDRGLQVSPPWQVAAGGPWLLTFFRVPADGRLPVAAVTVEASYFVSAYDPAQLGKRGALALLRRDGAVLAWQRDSLPAAAAPPALQGEALHQRETRLDRPLPLAGEPSWVAVRELYGVPVSVVVGLSASEQRLDADQARRQALALAALLTAAVLVVSGLLWYLDRLAAEHRRKRIEARITHAQQVEHLAYHDALTGLANRSLYSRLLAQEVARARRENGSFALMFLDLDRFKLVNDTLGHDVGDALLQEVGRRVQAVVREVDVVARLGGDEFVVLLTEAVDQDSVAAVARRVLAGLAPPCTLLGHELRITASLGIAFYPRDGLDEQTLAKHADVAMYQAKQSGRNGFQFYQPEQSTQTLERMALESALRAALARGELELHYQARRDLDAQAPNGAEALLRWRHPDLGMLPAARFLPLAEETGLIVPIGRWVLRTACAQLQQWRASGMPALTLSVNLSLRQFIDDSLLPDVRNALQEHDLPPACLELEVPEMVLMGNVETYLSRLDALKRLGVRIAVDNFGLGYASLATLRRVAVDALKLDRSLIRDLALPQADHRLPAAMIAMAHSLSLTVVAKGVENEGQAAFLREHDCNQLQGHYFAEPMPAAAFEALLMARAAPPVPTPVSTAG